MTEESKEVKTLSKSSAPQGGQSIPAGVASQTLNIDNLRDILKDRAKNAVVRHSNRQEYGQIYSTIVG